MSTTIRNIKVIIDGIQSQGFNITIDGNAYRMDDFNLSQHLLMPASLSFSIHRHEAEEDSKDATFSLSGRLIGKTIKLELSTDNVESESSISENEEKTADVKFLGIIKNVSCSRISTGYTLYVSAESWEYLLDSNPDCMSFENKTLKEILEEVAADYLKDSAHSHKMQVETEYTDKIPYCVMYNESQLHFIQRLALRYSEWMYNDGEKLVFGKLPEMDPVTLEYPGRDIENFSVNLTTVSHNFVQLTNSHYSTYNGITGTFAKFLDKYGDPKLSDLQKKTFDASEALYRRRNAKSLISGGYTEKNEHRDLSLVHYAGQTRVQLSQLVRYSGSTYSSRIKIGCRLQIKDNVVMSNESETHSDVTQEDILIIGLTHTFYADETYKNVFDGIPGVCMYPPYPEAETIAKAGPTRGYVTNNNDPEGLGRVRVLLDFQGLQSNGEESFDIDDLTNAQTPWIRVVQFYDTAKFIPEVGKMVLVNFEEGNADRPFVAGVFWQGSDPMDPEWTLKNNDNNEVKALRTWNGHTVEFHDVGREQGGFIHVYDQAKKYDVLLSTDGEMIRMRSAGDIQLIAKRDIVLQAGESVGITSGETTTIASDIGILMSAQCRRADIESDDTVVVGNIREVYTGGEERHRGADFTSIFSGEMTSLSDKSTNDSTTKTQLKTNQEISIESITQKEQTQTFSSDSKKYTVKTQDSTTETTKYKVEAKADASIKSNAKMAIESQIMNVDATQVQIQGKANASISAPSVTIN